MQQKNLDRYGSDPIPWSRALDQLPAKDATGEDATPRTTWLSTVRPEGKPHTTGVGALWVEDRFYFTSSPNTQKSRNLARNPNCVISVALPDLDLVVEGIATKVTDEATLERLAKAYADQGWPATAKDGALTAEYSAPSAGPPPWDLYEMIPKTPFGVAAKLPYGATRWSF
ncbi:MAG: pyridoxamine 5'-phosphate oxidase family protein [Chloroflexi bacterium]|nr:pyridoxamine 5'-phosphate oxidase family protein [Chloroflexota bacterium]